MTMPSLVRPLAAEDAPAFRALRLEALRTHPEAFGASHDDEAARPFASFAERLTPPAPSRVFGGFAEGKLRGLAGFLASGGEKKRHIGLLWGVYVAPERRGSGMAQALVETVIAHAAQHVAILHADVGVDNGAARRLYERLGFRCYGIEPKALCIDGVFIDEALLALDLAPGSDR